jgi:16S rRNA (guanine527-N7)-methyltransferase
MENRFLKILSEAASILGCTLGERELSLFELYRHELLLWNKRINLVSAKTPDEMLAKHFIDSLTPIPFIPNKNSSLLDIGTGAGFPGLPMKIVVSSFKLSLLEASRKKVSFLKHLLRIMALPDTHVMHQRLEELHEERRHAFFDVVISRAALKLPQFVRMGAPLLFKKGLLIAMKGPTVEEERLAAQEVSEKCGLVLLDCHEIRLPLTGDLRKIVVYQKVG